MTPIVRRLSPADADAFRALRRRALREEPSVFAASEDSDRGLQHGFVESALLDEDHQALFGAFDGDRLLGCAGLVRAGAPKSRHRATLWGMYVAPEIRGRGAGRELVDACIARAREWSLRQVTLCVSETAPAARRLYERAGFRAWGREPGALLVEGRLLDEDHLIFDVA